MLALARLRAQQRGKPLDRTLAERLGPGPSTATPVDEGEGLAMFRLPADSPTVTSADVRRLELEGP